MLEGKYSLVFTPQNFQSSCTILYTETNHSLHNTLLLRLPFHQCTAETWPHGAKIGRKRELNESVNAF